MNSFGPNETSRLKMSTLTQENLESKRSETFRRLYHNKVVSQDRNALEIEYERAKGECTFRPKISDRSHLLAIGAAPVTNVSLPSNYTV